MLGNRLTEIGAQRICAYCGKPFTPKWNIKRTKTCGNVCGHKLSEYTPERAAAEFWKKVDKSGACWLWTGFRKWDGYGWVQRNIDGKRRHLTAHRYAWYLEHGELPTLHILHTCDVPACCNPAHLRLGTHKDNMADMAAKGRQNSGWIKRSKPVLYPDRVRPERKVKEPA